MNLWTIERLREGRRYKAIDEVLVHVFGSTPIVCRNYQSAMRLAMHCQVIDPPAGLRWIGTAPNNCEAAMEIARKRRINEARGANKCATRWLSALSCMIAARQRDRSVEVKKVKRANPA